MYDPTIGRWISEDPIGFEAADPNLYRYVHNDPITKADPSGLQEQVRRVVEEYGLQNEGGRLVYNPRESLEEHRARFRQNLPVSWAFGCRVHFCEDGASVSALAKRIIVRRALAAAAIRIHLAWGALESSWPQVQGRLANNADLDILFGRNQRTRANRDFYRTNLQNVIHRLQDRDGVINFHINDRNEQGDAVAYVRTFAGVRGDTIYINPRFFNIGEGAQEMLMVHELGRLIVGISGNRDSAHNTNNIGNWDDLVQCLSDPTNRAELAR
jgi:hypothetical protein